MAEAIQFLEDLIANSIGDQVIYFDDKLYPEFYRLMSENFGVRPKTRNMMQHYSYNSIIRVIRPIKKSRHIHFDDFRKPIQFWTEKMQLCESCGEPYFGSGEIRLDIPISYYVMLKPSVSISYKISKPCANHILKHAEINLDGIAGIKKILEKEDSAKICGDCYSNVAIIKLITNFKDAQLKELSEFGYEGNMKLEVKPFMSVPVLDANRWYKNKWRLCKRA